MRFTAVLLLCVLCALPAHAQNLAIVDVTAYTSPEAAPRRHTTVLILKGKISSSGSHIQVPAGTPRLPCKDCFVFAGFWNCHVHFTGDQWTGAAHLPADSLTRELQKMLTGSGFTTVVDTSSDTENTVDLRRRIDKGEVSGPRIYTAGIGLYPTHGIPFYLDNLPQAIRAKLFQPSTLSEASQDVQHNIDSGTDIVKLFTGSYLSPERVAHMSPDIAQAAVAQGHKHQQLVFAHPSDLGGIRVAMNSGVDVLAHAPDTVDGVDNALLSEIVQHRMAMIPTLKLFSRTNNIVRIREIVAHFHTLGGELLFGTDTGFLSDDSVVEEYRQLALSGLSFQEVLAMLTTAPAGRFRLPPSEGRIQPGASGDLTVLGSNPAQGTMEDFANVRYTIRAGKVIFQKEPR